jgi:hypothetical protein
LPATSRQRKGRSGMVAADMEMGEVAIAGQIFIEAFVI